MDPYSVGLHMDPQSVNLHMDPDFESNHIRTRESFCVPDSQPVPSLSNSQHVSSFSNMSPNLTSSWAAPAGDNRKLDRDSYGLIVSWLKILGNVYKLNG